MIEVTGEGKALYKTGDNRLGRFPEAASEDLVAGPKRNFQVFDPLDFLAEVTCLPAGRSRKFCDTAERGKRNQPAVRRCQRGWWAEAC